MNTQTHTYMCIQTRTHTKHTSTLSFPPQTEHIQQLWQVKKVCSFGTSTQNQWNCEQHIRHVTKGDNPALPQV